MPVVQRALLLLLSLTPGTAFSGSTEATRTPGSVSDTLTVDVIYVVEVTASFESVTNLSLLNLGLTGVLSGAGDESRLPAGVSIPGDFPVKVDITPPSIPLLGLEFEGVASVILDTTNLDYTPGTRLRLFSAHNGGNYVDITEEVSSGSYRVRGSQGEFSEFLIVLDERDPAAIVATKFARLTTLMTTNTSAIDDGVEASLNTLLSSAQTKYAADDIDGAKVDIAGFAAVVAAATPAQIPKVWRSTEDVTNVAGILRAAAGTLHFSLEDARDTDLDGVYDYGDNCIATANLSQCDTDGDGYGNHCDADFDNNGIINSFDLTTMRNAFGDTGVTETDLNCNGVTNSFDLSLMRMIFGGPPGPAANLP